MALLWLVLSPLLGGCASDRETTLRRSSRGRAVGALRAERLQQERELELWEAACEEANRDIAAARFDSIQTSSNLRTVRAEWQRQQLTLTAAENELLAAIQRALQIEKELQPLRALEQQLRDQDALIKDAQTRIKTLVAEVAKATHAAAQQEAALKPKLAAVQARLAALKAAGVQISEAEAKIAAAQKVLAPPPAPKKK